MKRSVIFTSTCGDMTDFKYKIRVVNRLFEVKEEVIIKVNDYAEYHNCFQIYDPYNSENKFLDTIMKIAETCEYSEFYYFNTEGKIYEYVLETKEYKDVKKIDIDYKESETIGNIPLQALGFMRKKYPKLKAIENIELI